MDKDLKTMIERFFAAELTVDEEQALYRYLLDNDVPAELRNDKQTIIALCGYEADELLPEGAATRLESMLDSLAQEQETLENTVGVAVEKERNRVFKIPRYVWGTSVAAVVLLFFMLQIMPGDTRQTDASSLAVTELPERDTFDNPEDAMRCAKVAFGELHLAINNTQYNAKSIANGLSAMITGMNGLNNKK